jgi:hypothetical protein
MHLDASEIFHTGDWLSYNRPLKVKKHGRQ